MLAAHRSVGYAVNSLEGLVLLAALVAWLPRRDVLLSLALVVVGTGQIALAAAHNWAGGLHPLGALIVLTLATVLAARGFRRSRRTPAPAAPPR